MRMKRMVGAAAALMYRRRQVCRAVDGQRQHRQSPVDGSESPSALQQWAKDSHARSQTPAKMKVAKEGWMWLGWMIVTMKTTIAMMRRRRKVANR